MKLEKEAELRDTASKNVLFESSCCGYETEAAQIDTAVRIKKTTKKRKDAERIIAPLLCLVASVIFAGFLVSRIDRRYWKKDLSLSLELSGDAAAAGFILMLRTMMRKNIRMEAVRPQRRERLIGRAAPAFSSPLK